MSYRYVTIEEAKEIAETHGLNQIVIWHFADGEGQHVTTYGWPATHSQAAAEAGNHVKRAAGWDEESCRSVPRMNPRTIALAAAAIANARAGRRGAPPIANVLDILPDKLRREVTEDAEAVLAAIGFEREPKKGEA